jgi:hypothetical protein
VLCTSALCAYIFHTFVIEIRAAGVVFPVSFHVGVNDDAESMIELWLILGES